MEFDRELFQIVVTSKEGLRYREMRKGLAKFVRRLSDSQKQEYLERKVEIVNSWVEWKEMNAWVLRHLGFMEDEVELLSDKRLESPGMRRVIRIRAAELGFLRPEYVA